MSGSSRPGPGRGSAPRCSPLSCDLAVGGRSLQLPHLKMGCRQPGVMGCWGDSGHTGGSSLKLMVLPGGPREAELFKTGKPRLGMGGQWAPWPRLDGVPWPAEDNPVGLPDPPI